MAKKKSDKSPKKGHFVYQIPVNNGKLAKKPKMIDGEKVLKSALFPDRWIFETDTEHSELEKYQVHE